MFSRLLRFDSAKSTAPGGIGGPKGALCYNGRRQQPSADYNRGIPDEVLHLILTYGSQSVSDDVSFSVTHGKPFAFDFGQVCAHWRTLIRDPIFWTTIIVAIDGNDLEPESKKQVNRAKMLDWCLCRSISQPLMVHIVPHPLGGLHPSCSAGDVVLLDALTAHSSRWQSLSVYDGYLDHLPGDTGYLPQLKHLKFVEYKYNVADSAWFTNASQLHTAHFTDLVEYEDLDIPYEQLKSITLEPGSTYRIGDFCQSSPHLTEIVITKGLYSEEVPETNWQIYRFPELERLRILRSECSENLQEILGQMEAPHLSWLEISHQNYKTSKSHADPGQYFRDFLHRSSCPLETLILKHVALTTEELDLALPLVSPWLTTLVVRDARYGDTGCLLSAEFLETLEKQYATGAGGDEKAVVSMLPKLACLALEGPLPLDDDHLMDEIERRAITHGGELRDVRLRFRSRTMREDARARLYRLRGGGFSAEVTETFLE